MDASGYFEIFERCVRDYHLHDDVDAVIANPYAEGSREALLYDKCMVDSVQWHLEDLIRDPEIAPADCVALKRRIDRSNQVRTDMVEQLDTLFLNEFAGVRPLPEASINTESPAWAVDRLSILALKIWHMAEQAGRPDVAEEHRLRSQARLDVLLEQKQDLISSIDTLLADYAAGRKVMKVYRQMKLYNDPSTNPVLYGKK